MPFGRHAPHRGPTRPSSAYWRQLTAWSRCKLRPPGAPIRAGASCDKRVGIAILGILLLRLVPGHGEEIPPQILRDGDTTFALRNAAVVLFQKPIPNVLWLETMRPDGVSDLRPVGEGIRE